MGNQQRSFDIYIKERSTTRAKARTLQVNNGSGNGRGPFVERIKI